MENTCSIEEKNPALSGLSNDSCSGNSPTCSNVYVQTCDEGNDHDYCVRLDDDSWLLNTGFIDNGPDIMNLEDETDILNRGFLEDFEQNANGRTTLNHQECDLEEVEDDCVDFLKLQTEVQENISQDFMVRKDRSKLTLMQMYSHGDAASVKQSIEVHPDFKCTLFVHRKPVPRSHVIWTDLPLLFDRVSVIMELCSRLAVNSFCSLQLQEVINMNKLYVLDLTVFILF